MRKSPQKSNLKYSALSFLFIAAVIVILSFLSPHLYAAKNILGKEVDQKIQTAPQGKNIFGKDIGEEPSVSSGRGGTNIVGKGIGSEASPASGKVTNILGKEVGTRSTGTFDKGFDEAAPSWSQWQPLNDKNILGPDSTVIWPKASLITPLDALDRYKISTSDDPGTVALKIDDMIVSLSPAIVKVANAEIADVGLPQMMMTMADGLVEGTNPMYADIQGMYAEVAGMKAQLNSNYETYNASEPTMELMQNFNAQSDAMADRVAGMHKAVGYMKERVQINRDVLEGMSGVLDEMTQNGREAVQFQEQLSKHVDAVIGQFEIMLKDLKRLGMEAGQSAEDTRQYLASLRDYVKGNKPYATRQLDYINEVKGYLQNTQKYFDTVLQDLEQTQNELSETENYFRNAKIKIDASDEKLIAQDMGGDVCSAPIDQYKDVNGVKIEKSAQELEKDKPLQTLQDCAKSCRTVCRFKDKRGNQNCYECPSGSPDSCFDVGAWPADHPWCQPGGPCYDNPMMYCASFGTIGPNLEKLQCTNCKQRPDMCWQKVGGGMTYTNCKMGCWNGKCVFKGKYQEFEWDGKPEWIHCYECKTPPGPPTCEELGWGFDFYSDCEATCPAPGKCEKKNMKVPGPPEPPKPPGPPPVPPGGGGGADGGQQGGGGAQGPQAGGGDQGGGTGTGGGGTPPSTGGGGKKAGLPPGTPQQPDTGGGAGATAGGDKLKDGQTGQPSDEKKEGGDEKPPKEPDATEVKQPPYPDTQNKPKLPEPPPKPPENSSISFYKRWLEETKARIKSREDIIADPKEGDWTKAEAERQLESMNKDKEYVEKRVAEEEQKELERQKKDEEAKKRAEEYERTRVKPTDFGADMKERARKWRMDKFKDATEALKNKLQEARDTLTARRERIQKIDNEIAQLEQENKNINSASTRSRADELRLKNNTARLAELKFQRAEFAKKLAQASKKFNEELQQLKTEYQRRLWDVDINARRRAEASRMDEYFGLQSDLKRREETLKLRTQTFENILAGLEAESKRLESIGEDSDEIREQIENLKRGQTEWEEKMKGQIDRMKSQILDIEIRNMYEGVGPGSMEDLGKKLDEYKNIFQDQIAKGEKAIEALEKLSTRTSEQDAQLKKFKAQVDSLRGAFEGVTEKQGELKNNLALTQDEKQSVIQSTNKVANGMMSKPEDKSYARLALESVGEEFVHNLNPYVAAKKSLAFGVGIVQGVGSAVAGLAELGWEAIDTIGEAVAVDMGFESGGIFGTDNLDAINSAISTVGSNANFDGVIKAVVAAGGALDAKIKELEKSGDIDWATANFGGKVAGEVVVGDAVIAGAVGKASTLLRGADKVEDVATAAGKIDDIARAGTKVDDLATAGSHLDDAGKTQKFDDVLDTPGAGTVDDATKTQKFGDVLDTPGTGAVDDAMKTQKFGDVLDTPKAGVLDDAGDASKVGTKADDAPKSPDVDGAPARGPPAETPGTAPRAGVGPNSQATFTGPDGKPVTIKTGEELGHGSTSTVYADPSDAKKAIRITEPGKAGIEYAPQLDAAGRKAVETIQRPGGPIRIVEPGKPIMVNDPSSPLHGKIVEVVERVENGSADKFLAKTGGGKMSDGQAAAFDAATKELNKNGFAWMDNHTGNYGFEKVPGTADDWTVVVLDPGGIVPMKGTTLAEKAQHATDLQRALNVPEEGMADFINGYAKSPDRGPDFFKNFTDGERGRILDEFGKNIDTAAMGISKPHDIAFYPFGTVDYPNVGTLFNQ